MKFSCGEAWEHEVQRRTPDFEAAKEWHKVFCWWPKTLHVENGYQQCYWLCWIERRWGTMRNRVYHYCPADDFRYWALPSLGISLWEYRPVQRQSTRPQP